MIAYVLLYCCRNYCGSFVHSGHLAGANLNADGSEKKDKVTTEARIVEMTFAELLGRIRDGIPYMRKGAGGGHKIVHKFGGRV